MKTGCLMFFVSLCLGGIAVVWWANPAPAEEFPGDGYANPDALGVSAHGPALRHRDRGDGTFRDQRTAFVWEKKLAADGSEGGNCQAGTQAERRRHGVNNLYTWSATGTAASVPARERAWGHELVVRFRHHRTRAG